MVGRVVLRCLAVACAAAGCGESGEGGASSTSEARALPVGALVEETRIEGDRADLWGISALAVGPDETVAVSQSQIQAVRLFDREGVEIASVGGDGEGPGEFRQPAFLGRLGDSLTVYDPRLERFTVYTWQGEFARTVDATHRGRPGPDLTNFPIIAVGPELRLLADGRVVAALIGVASGTSSGGDQEVLLSVMTREGVVERVLARSQRHTPGVSYSEGNQSYSVPFPFPNEIKQHLSLDGLRFVQAEAALEGDDAGTLVVRAIDASGDTTFARRYPFVPVLVSEEFSDSVIAEEAVGIEKMSPRLAAMYRREAYLPAMMPPVLGILNGDDGTIWLRLRPSGDDQEYLVLAPDGDPIGLAEVPPGLSVRVARRDRVWGVRTSELGMSTVVRYAVTWEAERLP